MENNTNHKHSLTTLQVSEDSSSNLSIFWKFPLMMIYYLTLPFTGPFMLWFINADIGGGCLTEGIMDYFANVIDGPFSCTKASDSSSC